MAFYMASLEIGRLEDFDSGAKHQGCVDQWSNVLWRMPRVETRCILDLRAIVRHGTDYDVP